MATLSLVDTVSYVKNKGEGDYVVDHHTQMGKETEEKVLISPQ